MGWEELRSSAFGMERDLAQLRLNQAATQLILVLIMAAAEFFLVSFVVPSVPDASPLPTSTLNLLATPTSAMTALAPGAEQTLVETVEPAALATSEGCVADRVFIEEPKNGDLVNGVVTLKGTASIPDFGFYKYEIARPGDTVWLSINAGEKPVKEDILGDWVTDVLDPGDYLLRLVVVDNQGNTLPACVIQLRVVENTE
ncbi:MAG: hypothetical protein MUC85_03420 [Anaerolineales bacterium]|nr:hypothetical protein [Anaerolineales bacterium]